jgi:SAM-dependent methyltransferase
MTDAPSPVVPPLARWSEGGAERSARWRSEAGVAVPRRIALVDDTLSADAAWRLASEGTALLWRGDFHNARQLLQALARRADRRAARPKAAGREAGKTTGKAVAHDRPQPGGSPAAPAPSAEAFHRHRQALAQRARILGAVLIELEPGYRIALRRAPDLADAITAAWGPSDGSQQLVALRELQGLVGAHEWRKKGVEIAALGPPPGNRIHAHYGVFSPLRGEYLDLLAHAPLPDALAHDSLAFDVGTGTGVIAAVLARRGVARVVATDTDPRALACAHDNLARLGLSESVQVVAADLFPPGRAPLIVCNPPWVPARATAPVERAVYDEGSRMLRGFLAGLAAHLAPGGEGWLILSDLAEHLGLRSRSELLGWIGEAGLAVAGRADVRPQHPKVQDAHDPLHAARAAELTSLWRLRAIAA